MDTTIQHHLPGSPSLDRPSDLFDRSREWDDLQRLEEIRTLLLQDGADCEGARLLLFGRSGFEADLEARARRSPEVVLVDLHRLYGGS